MADDQFIGEIRIFAGSYAPEGWLLCDGQVIDIASNPTLYSLIGTTYGGDGQTNFALPDMRGRAPLQTGHGNGFSNIPQGAMVGAEHYHLSMENMPAHSHQPRCNSGAGNNDLPTDNYSADEGHPSFQLYSNTANEQMGTTSSTGESSSHPINTRSPCLALNFIIAIEGEYPPRP